MGVTVKVDKSGLEKFKKNLKKLSGEHKVSEADLFPNSFVGKYTDFPTFRAMLDASEIKDASEITGEPFSLFVAEHSKFSGWSEMRNKAYAEYAKRILKS